MPFSKFKKAHEKVDDTVKGLDKKKAGILTKAKKGKAGYDTLEDEDGHVGGKPKDTSTTKVSKKKQFDVQSPKKRISNVKVHEGVDVELCYKTINETKVETIHVPGPISENAALVTAKREVMCRKGFSKLVNARIIEAYDVDPEADNVTAEYAKAVIVKALEDHRNEHDSNLSYKFDLEGAFIKILEEEGNLDNQELLPKVAADLVEITKELAKAAKQMKPADDQKDEAPVQGDGAQQPDAGGEAVPPQQ